MKKILAWVLLIVLLLGMFAGCKKDPEQPETSAPTEFVPDGATAEDAMEYLRAMYKDTDEPTKTPVDYERYGIIRIAGIPFTVVWTVDVSEDLVKIIVNDDGTVTIDVNEDCEVATPYTLTATITDEYGITASHSWDMVLPSVADMIEIVKAAYALAPGESLPYEVTLRGKIISIDSVYNPEYKNITVTMVVAGAEDMPIQCYRLKGEGCENLLVGNIITVTGTLKNYNGTIEFDSGCMLENVEPGDAIEPPTDTGEILKAAYALGSGEALPYPVTLTGKVIDIDSPYDANYGNISVVMEMEGYPQYPVLCYRLKGGDVDQIAVEDTITVTGIIKNYKGTIEFDTGCILVDRISGGNVAKPESFDADDIMADAKKLSSGDSLDYYANLTGKVIEIDSPYDKNYGNISVIMVVKGYESTPITCYRMKSGGADVSQIAVGDTITVRGVIENYKGTIEFGTGCTLQSRISGGGVAKPETDNVKTIMTDAKQLASGEKLSYYATLTGKVTEIESPYDKNYGNITVVMQVKGYESTPITCYRLKSGAYDCSKIAVGDTITVRGVIENYKGKLEFGTGCTLEKRVSGGGVAKPETSNTKTIMTDAAKLASGEKLSYYATLTGKVTEIESPYDKNYGNITVVMQVSGYESTPITCYRLKSGAYDCSKIAVGDTITVRGVIENYNGKLEFGTGCTLEKRVSGGGTAKPETSDTKTIMTDAAKLASGEALSYYATLTGKVTEIESPYDKNYGNITVVMQVKGYESTPITCYRLKSGAYDCSKIAVGDTITVRGVIENYSGKLEFGSGCTLEKRVSGGGTAKPETSDTKTIMTDAAKLAAGESLSYYATLTGKVIDVETPYDKVYGNITVVIEVSGYEDTPITCYRLKSGAADASKIAEGDTITVRGVLENYKGEKLEFGSGCTLEKRVSGGGVAKPESSDAKTILADANKLAEGEALDYYANLTGKVTDIASPYDKNYGNITLYMDVDGTSMYCYRLKSGAADVSQIAVGDTITVRGVIENYKGSVQFGTGSTLEKRVSGGGTAKPETSDAKTIMTDAAALAAGEALDYFATLTGKVIDVETPYDANYGNITVVIEVSGYETSPITCYRMKSGAADASLVAAGDTITVRGVLENYKGEKLEFGAGCTLEKRVSGGGVAKPESTDEATILADAANLASGESLDYYATLTGKVTSIKTAYDPGYGNITVYMNVNGTKIQCYRLKSGAADCSVIRAGDTITVRGVIENYNGSLEFIQGCTLEARVEGYNPGDNMTPEQIVDAAYALDSNGILEGQYTLTGVIASVDTEYSSQYKNITVTMKVANRETMPIQCYRLKSGAANVANLGVGDTITVTGSLIKYSGRVQFDSAMLDAYIDGEPVESNLYPELVTAPVAGTAYKLFMEQENLNKTLYFAGYPLSETLSYYMAATEDPTIAPDVYLEEVTGGYRLYFMSGSVKTYFDMYQDGTYYSLKLTTEPSTVYTFDTTYCTLVAHVVDKDCYIGTYEDHDTFSCCYYSDIDSKFVAQLCVLVEKGAEPPLDTTGKQVVYTMSDYADDSISKAGNYTDVAMGALTVDMTKSCINSGQLRVYNNTANKSEVIIKSNEPIKAMILNMAASSNTNYGTLNVYGSNDEGATWTLIDTAEVSSTTYGDFTLGNNNTYAWIKFTATPAKTNSQLRITAMTLIHPEEE